MLSTHGWEKAIDDQPLEDVDRVAEKFTIPLEGAVASLTKIHAEFLGIM